MDLSYDDALTRLRNGESIDSLLRSLRPESEVQLERRAAAVRYFDRATFDAFSEGLSTFDEFVQQPAVERVPGLEGAFRIRASERPRLLADWIGTDGWRAANAALAAFFARIAPGGSIDELIHLLAAGPERTDDAMQLFRRLFDEADARFELSFCGELLELVVERSGLSEPFSGDIDVRRCRLNARQMWSEEYFRTTAYHERTTMTAELAALVGPVGAPILQLYGGGGLGKTMFIRWALARYLVPRNIPCARLDFQFESPVLLAHSPWRLALKVARQLNAQMPGGPFTEMVKEYQDFEIEEEERAADAPHALVRSGIAAERFNADAFLRLHRGLQEVTAPHPPVVVLDTLERVTLYQDRDILALIRLFAGTPPDARVHLLLAGRYNLEDPKRLPGFATDFARRVVTLPLKPFSRDEARTYLSERRGLSDAEQVSAIVDRSDGVPFKLSLFATIVQEDPYLEASAIREMPNVNVEYLIKRVVDQIQEPIAQWIIRHGVVPRQLTKSFLLDVMLPRLRDVQQSDAPLDSGLDDLPERLADPNRFKRGLEVPVGNEGADRVWATLERYAADYSWIAQSNDWPDTLVFHADVVDAMRGLLQDHPIFLALHDDAVRHYEARAASADEEARVRWNREALYHHFQRGGPRAVEAWDGALSEAERSGDPSTVREIAEELLGSEYVDENGAARQRFDGTPMVPAPILVRAMFEAALAGIEDARLRRLPATDQAWITAERRLADAERLNQKFAESKLAEGRLAIAKASLALLQSPATASALLQAAEADITSETRSHFEELRGDAGVVGNAPAAFLRYRAALEAQGGEIPDARGRALALKAAEAAAHAGDFVQAISHAEQALAAAEAAGDSDIAAASRRQLAEALMTSGKTRLAIEAAGRKARPPLPVPERERALLDSIEPDALRREGNILGASSRARRSFQRAFEQRVDADATVRDARGLLVKGILHAELYEFDEALAAWRDGTRAWDQLREPAGSFYCTFRAIRMLVRQGLQPQLAAQMMNEAERTASTLSPEAALMFRIVDAERLASSEPDTARSRLDEVLDAPDLDRLSPSMSIGAALQAFAMQHREDHAARLLAAGLERVEPALARLSALAPRSRSIELPVEAKAIVGPPLYAAIDRAQKGRVPRGIAIDALALLQWLGDKRRANAWIDRLAKKIPPEALFCVLPMRIIAARSEAPSSNEVFDRSLTKRFLKAFAAHPRICGILLLEDGERQLAARGRAPKADAIHRIDELLGDPAARPPVVQARYARLKRPGDARPKAAVSPPPPMSAAPRREVTLGGGAPVLSLQFGRDDAKMFVDDNQGERSQRAIAPLFDDLAGGSVTQLTQRGLVVPVGVAGRLVAEPAARRLIGRLLCDDQILHAQPVPVDLRIESAHSMFAAIPWELSEMSDGLTLPAHSQVRCLYRSAPLKVSVRAVVSAAQWALRRALNLTLTPDGMFGPQTASALEQFQSERGLIVSRMLDAHTIQALGAARQDGKDATPHVVILRRSLREQRRQVRGAAAVGFDVRYVYERRGWKVTELLDPSWDQLAGTLHSGPVHVLHANVATGESSRRGGLFLDVGHALGYEAALQSAAQDGYARAQGFGVTDLIDLLQPERTARTPLLVLDPPHIPAPTEAARQLLLRNAFASDLFRLGGLQAIVATGLHTGAEDYMTSTTLVDGLTAGRPLAAIAHDIRKAGTGDPASYTPALALFLHFADYAPWPQFQTVGS